MTDSIRRTLRWAAIFAALTVLLAACGSPEERARSYYQSGQAWLEKGDQTKARLEFQNALKLNEDMPEAWYGLAQIAEKSGNARRAIQTLQRVVELDNKHVQAHMKLGRYMLLIGQIDRAVELSNRAYELAPEDVDAMTLRAAVLFKLDDREGAVQESEKVLQRDPENAEAISIIAAKLMAENKLDDALAILNKGLTANDRNLGLQFLKIGALERLRDFAGVEKVLVQLIDLYPTENIFRNAYIRFLLGQNRQDEAESVLRASANLTPDDVNAQLSVVQFLNQVRGPDAARNELNALIKKGGDVFRYRLSLAQLDFANGLQEKAIGELNELVANSADASQANAARAQLVQMHATRNEVDEARRIISEILQSDAKNTDGLRLRASLSIASGKFEDAIRDLRTALSEQPDSAILTALLARAYALNGSTELADERYTIALRWSNLDPNLTIEYARFLRQQGQAERAETVIAEAATRAPRNVPLLAMLAELRLARADWVGAEQVAQLMRSIEEGNTISAEIQAAALSGQKRFDESIEVLKQAYLESPQAVRPLAWLVRAYVQAGKPEDAEAFLNGVLKANQNNAEALALFGSLKQARGDTKEAEKSFQKAINVQPENPIGYRGLSRLKIAEKDTEAAERIIRAGLEVTPDSFTLGLTLAALFEFKRDYGAAIAQYEELYRRNPQSIVVANNLASLLAEHRQDDASLRRASELAARLRNSPIPHFQDTLGWVRYRTGDFTRAVEILKGVAEALPDIALVRFHLGMAYFQIGEFGKAADELTEALRLAGNEPLPQAALARETLAKTQVQTQ